MSDIDKNYLKKELKEVDADKKSRKAEYEKS